MQVVSGFYDIVYFKDYDILLRKYIMIVKINNL